MAMKFWGRLPLPKAQGPDKLLWCGGGVDNTSDFCSPLRPNEPLKLAAIMARALGEQDLWEGIQQLLGPRHRRPWLGEGR